MVEHEFYDDGAIDLNDLGQYS